MTKGVIFTIVFAIAWFGCDSETIVELEWRAHQDTFSIYMVNDTFKFILEPHANVMYQGPTTVSHDSALTDSIRVELNLEVEVRKDQQSITKHVDPFWINDSLLRIGFSYNGIIPKLGSQSPQTSPALPQIKIISANIFIPPGAKAVDN